MKNFLILAILLCLIFLTGCFRFKKISYIEDTQDTQGFKENLDLESAKKFSLNFTAGKINYSDKLAKNAEFKTVEDFNEFIIATVKEANNAYKVDYYKDSKIKSNLVLNTIRNAKIPISSFKTEKGLLDAQDLIKEFESLEVLRIELFDILKAEAKNSTKETNYKILFLKEGVIPAKVKAIEILRKNMLEEEGLKWLVL